MKIKKENDNLILTIPLKQSVYDYIGEKTKIKTNNLVGIIDGYDQGFCQSVDMSYKGKPPQVGSWILHTDLDNNDFHKLCDDLGIEFIHYDTCTLCGKTIYGVHTINDAGESCHIECWEYDQRNPINQNKSNIEDLFDLLKEKNTDKRKLLESAYERGINEGKKIAKDILYEAIKEVFNK